LSAQQKLSAQALLSHATVDITGQTYSYTLFNDEALGSSSFLTSFTLAADSPFTVTNVPNGWTYDTDNATYIYWHNADSALPYLHDVAPGTSLSGFTITSTATSDPEQNFLEITSWNHTTDMFGPTFRSEILTPGPAGASVPEHSSKIFWGAMALSGVLFFGAWIRARGKV
jgi:hypothetical protein